MADMLIFRKDRFYAVSHQLSTALDHFLSFRIKQLLHTVIPGGIKFLQTEIPDCPAGCTVAEHKEKRIRCFIPLHLERKVLFIIHNRRIRGCQQEHVRIREEIPVFFVETDV